MLDLNELGTFVVLMLELCRFDILWLGALILIGRNLISVIALENLITLRSLSVSESVL
jgi:hypothetical protein